MQRRERREQEEPWEERSRAGVLNKNNTAVSAVTKLLEDLFWFFRFALRVAWAAKCNDREGQAAERRLNQEE